MKNLRVNYLLSLAATLLFFASCNPKADEDDAVDPVETVDVGDISCNASSVFEQYTEGSNFYEDIPDVTFNDNSLISFYKGYDGFEFSYNENYTVESIVVDDNWSYSFTYDDDNQLINIEMNGEDLIQNIDAFLSDRSELQLLVNGVEYVFKFEGEKIVSFMDEDNTYFLTYSDLQLSNRNNKIIMHDYVLFDEVPKMIFNVLGSSDLISKKVYELGEFESVNDYSYELDGEGRLTKVIKATDNFLQLNYDCQ
jgi:hypothetical protein